MRQVIKNTRDILSRLSREQTGMGFILVLIFLLLGSLTIAPILNYMAAGIAAAMTYEDKSLELYAADAGIEDAIWQINSHAQELPGAGEDPWEYTAGTVNTNAVAVSIDYINKTTYKIISTATGADGSNTVVRSYVEHFGDYSYILDNAIISNGDIVIQPGGEVSGKVWYNPEQGTLENKGTIADDDIIEQEVVWIEDQTEIDNWSGFYQDQVSGSFTDSSINLEFAPVIDSLYRDGDLEIRNMGDKTESIIGGTIFVTGNLEFMQPGGGKDYTINLNGKTIFVQGTINLPPHRVTLKGSGCIIAIGDIQFRPNIASEDDDFILVMSLDGQVFFNPAGDFHGCLAGDTIVDLQPGCSLEHEDPPDTLNFPGLNGYGDTSISQRILTYEINPQ